MLDCRLYGLDPAGPHLTNLPFHIVYINSPAVPPAGKFDFQTVAFRLCGPPVCHSSDACGIGGSISERKDVLSGRSFSC